MLHSNDKFMPGLNYNLAAFVQNHDRNTPVSDEKNPVEFTITYHYDIERGLRMYEVENKKAAVTNHYSKESSESDDFEQDDDYRKKRSTKKQKKKKKLLPTI